MRAPAGPPPAADSEPVAWLRRCNGEPAAGVLTRRAEAAAIPRLAGTRNLRGSLDEGMSWQAAGREFTLEPLTDAQFRAWRDEHGVIAPTRANT